MKVLVLAGGDSSEREVSLTSGRAVFETLRQLGHTVYAVDPATGASLLTAEGKFITVDSGEKSNLPDKQKALPLAFRINNDLKDIDVAFIALHGGDGENGLCQSLLELAGVRYTGAALAACALSMDKAITTRLCRSEGILTPQWEMYRLADGVIPDNLAEIIAQRFTLPVVVKPNDSGSTVGLTKVEQSAEINGALQSALKESTNILVEQFIPGRELTVAVLDGRSFPIIEIVPESGLYDYKAKYTDGKSEYICPAVIPASVTDAVRRAAVKLFEVIGCAGLARVDFILDEDGRFYCLELNSVPGMTDLSLAPMAAKADGIDFPQLMQMLLESALDRPAK